ncbi:acrylyl-CoA reductase family protein [Paenibacillus pini]|uniref:Alcohol dehydrogenase n=1 Tax=Paenibacillus pini JCM 16418 TaxID=1236976 RepID=W7Z635_9BACL|nr:acryloyl-CoA reductase [Paenibacillus pini]GAF09784.1 alcohol dehydrogenase [Paenibacillus pini JCM 16418]
MDHFQAFVLRKEADKVQGSVEILSMDQLPDGDVTVKVEYTGVNYKDGLASLTNGGIVNRYPFIPGIDLAGVVVSSEHSKFKAGDQVICTGYGLGSSHYGGFSRYTRLSGEWLVHLPEGLSLREAMGIGTAGFTAAESIERLIRNGLTPSSGPVLVTGASGGVGSMAINMLSKLGYEVTASTGKHKEYQKWLKQLGAAHVVTREDIQVTSKGVLGSEQWAAVIDPVGGPGLTGLLKSIRYGGGVALSGLTGGTQFDNTVYPFILRGVQLLGIDSVLCPMDLRIQLWNSIAHEWKPDIVLEMGLTEKRLEDLVEVLPAILNGEAVGRTIIHLDDRAEKS